MRIHALTGGYLDARRDLVLRRRHHAAALDGAHPLLARRPPARHAPLRHRHPRDARVDPVGRLGAPRAARFGIRSGAADNVTSQLALLVSLLDNVDFVANSHFHFDHCGGKSSSARRPSSSRSARWTPRAAPPPASFSGYTASARRLRPSARLPPDRRRARRVRRRPGRAVPDLRPHPRPPVACGSARGKGPDLVLTADACYTRENMDRDVLPSVALGRQGDVALARHAPRPPRPHGARSGLRPRPRPVAGAPRAPAPL